MIAPGVEMATITFDVGTILSTVAVALLTFWGGKGALDWLKGHRAARRRQALVDARAKADARADWATFSAEMQNALALERQQVVQLLERIAGLEARLVAADEQVRASQEQVRVRDDHIDTLEAHIWEEKGPPPPPRP